MADYISREAAYKTLTEYYHHSSGVQHTVLREALNRVPTADVRPVVRGKWKKRMEEKNTPYYKSFTPIWSCSECGTEYDPSLCMTINFCPNCGAMMEDNLDTTKGAGRHTESGRRKQ